MPQNTVSHAPSVGRKSVQLLEVQAPRSLSLDEAAHAIRGRPERLKITPCHICGREFGASALSIHLMQCEKTRVAQDLCPRERDPVRESQLVFLMSDEVTSSIYGSVRASSEGDGNVTPLDSGYLPSAPSGNASSNGQYNSPSSSASPSPRGRRMMTISSTSEEVLAKVLKKGNTATSLGTTNENGSENCSRTAIRTVICNTCGREFAVAPYRIHRLHCSPGLVEERASQRMLQRESQLRPSQGDKLTPDDIEASIKVVVADAASGFNKRAKSMANPDSPKLRSKTTFTPENRGVVISSVLSEKSAPTPKVVLCYICGREFGIGSVDVHMPQCRKRWEAKEALKPPDERRTLPTPPEALPSVSPEEYNQLAHENWFDEMLVACGHCGKNVPDESLLTHQRSCAGKTGKILCSSTTRDTFAPEVLKSMSHVKSTKVRMSNDEGETGRLRQAAKVTCHICRREFGKDTIAIHSAECASRHEAQELAKKELASKTVAPGTGSTDTSQGAIIISTTPPALSNARSATRSISPLPRSGTWSANPVANRSKTPCQYCGRQFGPTAIQIHETQCAKKLGGQEVPDRRERCEHCGNMFLPDRLQVHLLTCNQWKDLGN